MRTLKFLFILIIVTLSLPKGVSAQYVQPMRYPHYSITQQANIGVGTVRTTAASAYLEVGPTSGANKGFLPPRLSTTERDAIASPANGLMIYNKTTNNFQGWNGSAWVNFYIDTTASFISNFYRIGDSVKYIKGGIHYFAYLDSTGGGGAVWGGITGTLSDQTDLQDSLNTRVRGSGTSNYIPRWTGTNTIGNSTLLYDNDVNAGTTNRFLAPSMGSASTNNHYTFYYDANEGQGPVFTGTDGGVIQFLRLAGYKYVQDYPTSSKGFYVGTYLNSTYNSYILFKSMGNRIMMNTLTDSSHQTVIHGTSIKIDADTITVNNIPDAVDMTNKKAVIYDEIDERFYVIEEDSVGGASTSGVTAIGSINSATKSSNGAVVVGSNLIMQNADATYPGLMSPAHYNFLDSVRQGLVADSSYLGLVAGPGSYDSVFAYTKPYGESAWDSAYQFLVVKSAGGDMLKSENLSGLANYTTARSNLGLAIGTNVQAYDADLDTWATKTAPSGTVVGTTDVQTVSNKRWVPRVGSTTSSATPTINTDNYDIYKLTAQTADITSFTTNLTGTPNDGEILEIQITGTAARAITWGASFVASTVALPTTTVTTTTLTVVFQYYTTSSYGNNKWVCVNSY